MGGDMNVELTMDMELVNSIIKQPDIWHHIAEEGYSKNDYYPSSSGESFWLIGKDKDEVYGLISVTVETSISLLIHPYMVNHGKGFYMMKSFLKWFIENTELNKINVKIPTFNTVGFEIARKLEFREEGLNRQSYKDQGSIYDQVLLGITRSEVEKVLNG